MSKSIDTAVEDIGSLKPTEPAFRTQIVNPGIDDDDWQFLQSFDEKAQDKIFHKVLPGLFRLARILKSVRSMFVLSLFWRSCT
jgi:hypothetical protein